MKRGGFTLIEILIVVAIVGVIASAAMAPLVFSVSRIVDAEEVYNEENAATKAIYTMVRDVYEALRMVPTPVLRVQKKEKLGSESDSILIVASVAPVRLNKPAGSLVYQILQRNTFSSIIPGLYRWVLPSIFPGAVIPENLKEEAAELVLPGVESFNIEVMVPPDWTESYSGGIPKGMKFTVSRGGEKVEYVEWFPQ